MVAHTRRIHAMTGTPIDSLGGCGVRRPERTRRAALAALASAAAGRALAACGSATRDAGGAGDARMVYLPRRRRGRPLAGDADAALHRQVSQDEGRSPGAHP